MIDCRIKCYVCINNQKRGYLYFGKTLDKSDQPWITNHTSIDWNQVAAIRATTYLTNTDH
jgi:hypothetical protein